MNQENQNNAEVIAEVLALEFENAENSNIKVLDVCCGVYDNSGTSYDPKGDIYKPLVADHLARLGYDVTGIDRRENNSDKNIDEKKYLHRNDIDILEENWNQKLSDGWDAVIFLRSWDTPEILLHYQKVLDIKDINLLSLEIAKILLPNFAELLNPKGLFFTTDICNLALCEDEFEAQLYQNQIKQLVYKNGLDYINQKDGLSWFRKNI